MSCPPFLIASSSSAARVAVPAVSCLFALALVAGVARAQEPPPQYPPQQYPPQQYPPQQYPPQQYPPQQYPQQYPPPQQPPAYYPPPQQPYYYPPQPPPPRYNPPEPPEPPTHAPKFSLWVGPRLSYMGFGLNFYNDRDGTPETTGNFVGNGVATQIDLGARLAHRYIPHVFYEHGFMGQGHRFEGTSASSSTDYYGIGFRFGGADDVGFVSDIAFGKRVIHVSDGNQSWTMSGLELFKLGLGAEFRLQTLFTIEAMFTVSLGEMTDTSGYVDFGAEGAKDGKTHPDYTTGQNILDTTTYVNLSLGIGVHFDVFGK